MGASISTFFSNIFFSSRPRFSQRKLKPRKHLKENKGNKGEKKIKSNLIDLVFFFLFKAASTSIGIPKSILSYKLVKRTWKVPKAKLERKQTGPPLEILKETCNQKYSLVSSFLFMVGGRNSTKVGTGRRISTSQDKRFFFICLASSVEIGRLVLVSSHIFLYPFPFFQSIRL